MTRRPNPILSSPGVPDQFVQVLNSRFRDLAQAADTSATDAVTASIVSAKGLKSPLDFGGVGDGAHDDTTAVAAAVALGYLFLPPTYTFVTAGFTVTKSYFSMFGGGALFLKGGVGTDFVTLDGSAFVSGTYPGNGLYAHINNVAIIGNAANQPVNLGACLVLKNAAYTSVQDSFIYAGSGDGIRVENANSSPNADEVNIINNRIFSNGRHGIYLHSTCLPVSTTIAANVAIGSHTVTPASMTNIKVGATLIVANSGAGNLEFVVVTAITGSTFTAPFTSTKTGPGITVVSTYGHVGDHVIALNHVNYNGSSGIRGTFLTSSIIQGNNVLTNGTGIHLDGADRCVLNANAVRNNKGSGVIIDQHAAVSYTDLLINGSGLVSSFAKPFTDEDVGLQLTVTGGTGFTHQTVMILSIVAGLGIAVCTASLGTTGSSGGVGTKNGFGRSKQIMIQGGNQLHFNGVQTSGDELDVFHTDGCGINGNYLGDTDFTPVAQYGIQLTSDCTGIVISNNDFEPTVHGPLLAPLTAGVQTPYRSLGNINLADGMQGTLANLPTPAANDYGVTYYVTDYQHVLLWIGTQWVFALGDSGSGFVVNSVGGILTAGVWHPCDGTNATILNGDGTTQTVTTAVLGVGFYIRL